MNTAASIKNKEDGSVYNAEDGETKVGGNEEDSFSTPTTTPTPVPVDDSSHCINNRDDEPLHKSGESDDQLVSKESRASNLITALVLTGFVFLAMSVFNDAYNQWLYSRFQIQVLGANFSKLNISLNKDPCLRRNHTMNKYTHKLNEAQALASNFISRTAMLSFIPAIFINMLFGAYSDRIGRKLFFIFPFSGILINFATVWAVCFWDLQLYWVYVGFALNGLSGSYGTLYMAIYTYTADNTEEKKSRSLGMILVSGTSQSLGALSHVATGYAISEIRYMWPLAVSSILVFIGLIGVLLFLKETLPRQNEPVRLSLFEGVKSIFVLYTQKPSNPKYRQKDFLILALIFVLYLISIGPSIQTLFLLDEPFCWNSKKIGIMEAIVGLIQSMVPLFVLHQLQKYVSDETVCAISLVSAIAIKFTFSIAEADWMIYMGLAFSIMQSPVLAFVRAIMSKMVLLNKRGSLMASLAVIEMATTAASGAGLNAVYSATVKFWRGLTYFIIAVFMVLALLLLIGYIIMKKKRLAKMTREEINSKNEPVM